MQEPQRRFSRLNSLGRSVAVALSILPLAAATAAFAQPWSGGSTLGVQIRGAEGPVEGAIVEVRYRRPGLTAGPESRRTDGSGQANFLGLVQGRWSLEIRHPEYLSFVASINVEPGKRAEVVTQFLEASGPGRKTFKVKFLRSDRSLGVVVPGSGTREEPQRLAAAEPEPSSGPASAAEAPATTSTPAAASPKGADRAPAVSAAGAAPAEAPASQPLEAPRAEDPLDVSEPVSDQPAPKIPGTAREATPAVEPVAAQTSGDDPVIGMPPPVAAAPQPAPLPPASSATPAGSPGADSVQERLEGAGAIPAPETESGELTAFRDRTCFECKPGEWAVSAEIEVSPGEPCRSTGAVAVRRAMLDVAAAASEQLADFSGPLPTDFESLPLSLVPTAARNTLAPYLDRTSSCRFVAIVIPAGGRFTGFRLEAEDKRASGACTGDQECEIGRARFLFSPTVARGAGASIVYSAVENTGAEARTARMTGFFVPPSGWSPE